MLWWSTSNVFDSCRRVMLRAAVGFSKMGKQFVDLERRKALDERVIGLLGRTSQSFSGWNACKGRAAELRQRMNEPAIINNAHLFNEIEGALRELEMLIEQSQETIDGFAPDVAMLFSMLYYGYPHLFRELPVELQQDPEIQLQALMSYSAEVYDFLPIQQGDDQLGDVHGKVLLELGRQIQEQLQTHLSLLLFLCGVTFANNTTKTKAVSMLNITALKQNICEFVGVLSDEQVDVLEQAKTDLFKQKQHG